MCQVIEMRSLVLYALALESGMPLHWTLVAILKCTRVRLLSAKLSDFPHAPVDGSEVGFLGAAYDRAKALTILSLVEYFVQRVRADPGSARVCAG